MTGSTHCTAHGGNADTTTPDKVRQRPDRTRQQCTANARGTGERCKSYAIHGATVCRKHGGALPQVQKKARERFNDMVDPMINMVGRLVKDAEDGKMTHADQMRLATFIADRTGFGTKSEVEVTVKPWEKTMKGILKTVPPEYQSEPQHVEMLALEAPSASPRYDPGEVVVAEVEPDEPGPRSYGPQIGSANPPRRTT